jgi:PKD repeat protein
VAHRIRWKVPQQRLKNASILSGGALEDGSDGTPATTGFRWYFASVPFGTAGDDVLTLKADCTGPVCNPGLTAPGNYRYWVSVPYRGGFRTPDCPGLAEGGTTCTGSEMKTFAVTDVVLSLTAPTQSLVGSQTISVTSTSKKGSVVQPCLTTTGFQYHFCQDSGGSCPAPAEQDWLSSGLTVSNPFPSTGSGTITLPNQPVGTWGLRIRYAYETGGGCADASVAPWPATGYSQLVVTQSVPSIRLRNSTDTADIPKSMGIYWELATNQTARAYAELNGVRDTNPPTGLAWSYRLDGGTTETPIGAAQGSSFSIATAGDYEVILRGYGDPVYAKVGVTSSGGTPTPTGPPTVNSVTASPSSPALGQAVTFTCNATQGGAPITSYDWVLESGVTRTTTWYQTSYAYATAGTKTFSCTANDSAGQSGSRVGSLTVSGGGGGTPSTCSFDIVDPVTKGRISYDSGSQTYFAKTGQALEFVAAGVTGGVTWNLGNGTTGSTNPFNYTYSSQGVYSVTLTATGCNTSRTLEVSGVAGIDFSVVDAGTGVLVARTGSTFQAKADQLLRFTSTGTTGAVSWAFGDGTTSTSASPEKAYAPAVDTSYTVTLTNGSASKQYSVFVKGLTGAALTGTYTVKYADGTEVNRAAVTPNKAIRFTAADQATSYTWDFGDGSPLRQGSPIEHAFSAAGVFAVELTVGRTGVEGTVTTAFPPTFSVTAPPDPLLWVAGGMVYADGGGGARWQSDLSIHNPGTATATIELGFVAGKDWTGSSGISWLVEAIPARQTKTWKNVLSKLFDRESGAWGAVLVRGDPSASAPPVIVSRTYNAANAGEAGTFGLSVPAISVASGVKPQQSGVGSFLAGLRHDATFRTNLAVANLKGDTAEVEVLFRDASGSVLGSPAKITIEAGGVKQLNAALSAPPAVGEQPIGGAGWQEPVSHFSAEVRLKKGSGVFPFATVIDNGTGDAIVVTPAPRSSSRYRLPGIVRTGQWLSDVTLLNPTAQNRRVLLEYSYVKTGEDRTLKTKSLQLKPFEMIVWVDFFKSILGLEGEDTGTYQDSFVDVSPDLDDPAPTEPLGLIGKTYTSSEKGSTGLQVDPYTFDDGMGAQASARRILLSGLEANTGFRSNVALFLAHGAGPTDTAEVDVKVYDSRGIQVGPTHWVRLTRQAPLKQINSDVLFKDHETLEEGRASIVIDNPRGTARVGAYATVIDNLSGDATFVAGQPAP